MPICIFFCYKRYCYKQYNKEKIKYGYADMTEFICPYKDHQYDCKEFKNKEGLK